MRVLLSGGGTAGHINPAIAIAKHIQKKEKNANILFVGTPFGMENKFVPREGFEIKHVQVSGLKRKLTFENVKIAFRFIKAIQDSKKIIKEFKPDVVIGTGGYVCAPVIFAAHKMGIPSIIHEQNVFPGLVVKMVSDKVDITAISFEETKDYLKKAKRVELTGNPIRENILNKTKKESGEPLVMISGGSLGADSINNAIVELLSMPGQDYYGIVMSTGERNYEKVMAKIKEKGIKLPENKKILPYIYNMDEVLAESDLAITRGGAITVSELCAIGKPSIIIPSPNVVHDHQTYNARFMEKKGAAVMIKEEDLSGEILAQQIKLLLSNKENLEKMSQAGKEIGILTACETIYNFVKELM